MGGTFIYITLNTYSGTIAPGARPAINIRRQRRGSQRPQLGTRTAGNGTFTMPGEGWAA